MTKGTTRKKMVRKIVRIYPDTYEILKKLSKARDETVSETIDYFVEEGTRCEGDVFY